MELEFAHVKIDVQSGAFAYVTDDFGYLGADGNVYRPTTAAGVDKALNRAQSKQAGRRQERSSFAFHWGAAWSSYMGGFVRHPEAAWRSTT